LLAVWVVAALWMSAANAADAENGGNSKTDSELEEIIVTGSLIRSTDVQAFRPVLSITLEDCAE
jgi:hypothetical protein